MSRGKGPREKCREDVNGKCVSKDWWRGDTMGLACDLLSSGHSFESCSGDDCITILGPDFQMILNDPKTILSLS